MISPAYVDGHCCRYIPVWLEPRSRLPLNQQGGLSGTNTMSSSTVMLEKDLTSATAESANPQCVVGDVPSSPSRSADEAVHLESRIQP